MRKCYEMPPGTIDANKEILQKIFSEDFWFIIPEYQRSYVWQTDFCIRQSPIYFSLPIILKIRCELQGFLV
jgi:uncharacterized protein with ParB-like and HNH nuclease domain